MFPSNRWRWKCYLRAPARRLRLCLAWMENFNFPTSRMETITSLPAREATTR